MNRRDFLQKTATAMLVIPFARIRSLAPKPITGPFLCYLSEDELREMQPILKETWGAHHVALSASEHKYLPDTQVEMFSVNEVRQSLGLPREKHRLANEPILERQA